MLFSQLQPLRLSPAVGPSGPALVFSTELSAVLPSGSVVGTSRITFIGSLPGGAVTGCRVDPRSRPTPASAARCSSDSPLLHLAPARMRRSETLGRLDHAVGLGLGAAAPPQHGHQFDEGRHRGAQAQDRVDPLGGAVVDERPRGRRDGHALGGAGVRLGGEIGEVDGAQDGAVSNGVAARRAATRKKSPLTKTAAAVSRSPLTVAMAFLLSVSIAIVLASWWTEPSTTRLSTEIATSVPGRAATADRTDGSVAPDGRARCHRWLSRSCRPDRPRCHKHAGEQVAQRCAGCLLSVVAQLCPLGAERSLSAARASL